MEIKHIFNIYIEKVYVEHVTWPIKSLNFIKFPKRIYFKIKRVDSKCAL
jgi:hypothetical protein